jgi:hypothetical protein
MTVNDGVVRREMWCEHAQARRTRAQRRNEVRVDVPSMASSPGVGELAIVIGCSAGQALVLGKERLHRADD